MILPVVFLCLTAVLPLSTAQDPKGVDALSTSRPEQQKLIVDMLNTFRRAVNPPASNMLKMEWSPPAAENAQNWANQCTFRHSPPYERRTDGVCGENLFMSKTPLPWSDVLQSWYNEGENFEYGTGATKGSITHDYTQMVQYNSYKVGCGFASCSNKSYKNFYVCHYCPEGNLVTSIKKPYKEGQPCGDCPNACDNGLCTNPCKDRDHFENCKNLKTMIGCSNYLMEQNCSATCKCTTEIV